MFFFYEIQYSRRKYPRHVSFIVHSHIQISNILHTQIELENNYVLVE